MMAVTLVSLMFAANLVPPEPDQDFAEYFAGARAVSKGLMAKGYVGKTFEFKDDPVHQNILSDWGFIYALQLLLRIRPGGLAWFAIVCSSWVWMCRNTTNRRSYNAEGDAGTLCVKEGNIMCARVALLMIIAHLQGVVNVVENPSSTVIRFHRRFEGMLQWMKIFAADVMLGHFGAPSQKTVKLFSDQPWINEVAHHPPRTWYPRSKGVTKISNSKDGRRSISGDRGLKATQEYPVLFGAHVAKVYHAHHCPPQDVFASEDDADDLTVSDIFNTADTDEWVDAELDGVLRLLMSLVESRKD